MFAVVRTSDRRTVAPPVRFGVGLVLFYAGALVAPWHAGVAAVGALVIAFAQRNLGLPKVMSRATNDLVVVSGIVVVSAVLPFLLHPPNAQGIRLLAQFLLLPSIAALFLLVPRSRRIVAGLWCAVTAGAIVAGAVAVVQVVVFGAARASGTEGNAIVFGDLALLMAALSAALVGPAGAELTLVGRGRAVPTITLVACASGTVASVLSGSRGGWLAIPVIACLLVAHHGRRTVERPQLGHVAFGLAAIGLAVGLAHGVPFDRVEAAIDDVSAYATAVREEGVVTSPAETRADPARGTTVGARIEAWRSAADAFANEPVLGIGWGNLQEHFRDQVVTEGRHGRIATFTHAHNQFLSALAAGGLLGAAAITALLVVPAVHFRRAWRSPDRDQRALALAGLIAVAAYGVFGLTESILENVVPVLFLAVTLGALTSQLDGEAIRSGRLAAPPA